MITLRYIAVTATCVLLLPMGAFAESLDDLRAMSPEQRREYVQSLSADEREVLRASLRERREEMRTTRNERGNKRDQRPPQ
jgi:hypothetical protein